MRKWRRGGNAAIRHFASELPADGIAYMTGDGIDREHQAQPPYCEAQKPASMEELGYSVFGAAVVYGYLLKNGFEDERAWQLSLGWQSDIIDLYANEAQQSAAFVWRILFRTEDDAQLLYESLTPVDGIQVERKLSEITIWGTNATELAESWQLPTDC
jgi:hypothetical protein